MEDQWEAWGKLFDVSHLSPDLQEVARPFAALAKHIADTMPKGRRYDALKPLLAARDITVSAAQYARLETTAPTSREDSMAMAKEFLSKLRGG